MTHPPTIVSIEISEDQRCGMGRRLTPTYKFSVPDDIDSEDAMEEDNEPVEDAEAATSDNGGQSLSHAVDLTNDKSELIDLTSEPDQTLYVYNVSETTRLEEKPTTEAAPVEDYSPTFAWDSFYQSSVHSDESDDEDGDDGDAMHEDSEVDDDDCDHDCDSDSGLHEDGESSLCSEINDGMDISNESEEEEGQ